MCNTCESNIFTRRDALRMAVAGSAAISLPLPSFADNTDFIMTPDAAKEKLIAGNKRFLASPSACISNLETRKAQVKNGQQPFATIITCADSRVPPEAIFGACMGDLFVCRNAGNLVDDYVLGSVEYAVEHLKTPIIVIMGHTGCGAVQSTLDSMAPNAKEPEGALGTVVKKIRGYAEKFRGNSDLLPTPAQLVEYSASMSRADIYSSPVVLDYARKLKIICVFAVYNMETGEVTIA